MNSSCYLVLKPQLMHDETVHGFKVVRSTQSKPSQLNDGEIYVKLNLSLPKDVFDPVITVNAAVDSSVAREFDAQAEAARFYLEES